VGFEGANLANLVQVTRRPFFSLAPRGHTELVEVLDPPYEHTGYRRIFDVSRSFHDGGGVTTMEYLDFLQGYVSFEPQLPPTARTWIRGLLAGDETFSFRRMQDTLGAMTRYSGHGWSEPEAAQALQYVIGFTNSTTPLRLHDDTRRFIWTYSPSRLLDYDEFLRAVRDIDRALPYNLGRLIADARDPTSEVSRYYQRVFDRANSEELHQVLRAFDELRRYL